MEDAPPADAVEEAEGEEDWAIEKGVRWSMRSVERSRNQEDQPDDNRGRKKREERREEAKERGRASLVAKDGLYMSGYKAVDTGTTKEQSR